MISENYDNWFDENQKLYYSEDSVLKLIEILLKNNYEEMITIKLTEKLNYVKKLYALYSTDKDVNILFVKKEKFENDPKKYKLLEKLDFNYKVYLNKHNEILFATTETGKTVVGISFKNFENFEIIQEIF